MTTQVTFFSSSQAIISGLIWVFKLVDWAKNPYYNCSTTQSVLACFVPDSCCVDYYYERSVRIDRGYSKEQTVS